MPLLRQSKAGTIAGDLYIMHSELQTADTFLTWLSGRPGLSRQAQPFFGTFKLFSIILCCSHFLWKPQHFLCFACYFSLKKTLLNLRDKVLLTLPFHLNINLSILTREPYLVQLLLTEVWSGKSKIEFGAWLISSLVLLFFSFQSILTSPQGLMC